MSSVPHFCCARADKGRDAFEVSDQSHQFVLDRERSSATTRLHCFRYLWCKGVNDGDNDHFDYIAPVRSAGVPLSVARLWNPDVLPATD